MEPRPRSIRVVTFIMVLALLALDFSQAAAAAPQITSLSSTTLARSGRLRIFGSTFGTTSGQVLIDGRVAPIADWTDIEIIAYVPETATLASVPVQVVTSGGSSNTVSLSWGQTRG